MPKTPYNTKRIVPANTTHSDTIRQALLERAMRERQKRQQTSVPDFGEWLPQATPEYNWDWPYLKYVQRYVDRITRREIDRLMIFLPPRHGKSEQVTVRYPAYEFERDPTERIVIATHTAELAKKFSRKTRGIVRARNRVELDPERYAVNDWLTAAGGGLRAVGVGGAIAGLGFKLLLLDDLVRSREEVNSKAFRERTWEWFTDDLWTRREPGAAVILQMCMTGDTPVLMANGTERSLRDVRPGDIVATFDNGKLTSTTVRNHRSSGLDSVFRIKTTCGKIVRANGRHPFLTEYRGQLQWTRLKDLNIAHRIVIFPDSGENGGVNLVPSRIARNQSAHADTVVPTTPRKCAPMDTYPHPSMLSLGETPDLNLDTESLLLSMMRCSLLRGESAPFANYHPEIPSAPIGAGNYALTTAIERIASVHSYATTVTLPSVTQRIGQPLSPLQNTSDFTTTGIESITSDGVEEVFDVEIGRTENFIANGAVSHNTRWHEDDIAGRILAGEDAENWTVIKMPALMRGTPDPEDFPIRREYNDALNPDRFDTKTLLSYERVMGSSFSALYQQEPTPEEGEIFKKAWFNEGNTDEGSRRTCNKFPERLKRTQMWDTAMETKERNDFSAMVEGCRDPETGIIYVAGMVNERLDFPALAKRMKLEYERVGVVDLCTEDKANGKPARQQLKLHGIPMIEVPAGTTDKEVRAKSITQYCEAGHIVFVMQPGNINEELFRQLITFPNAAHDDLVDAFVHLIRRLTAQAKRWSKDDIKRLMESVVEPESITEAERAELREQEEIRASQLR